MANLHRGEIEAQLNGERYCLVLTLGALAELEAAFGDADMLALAARFESGRFSARDLMRVIGAGLRGAGSSIKDEDVAHLQAEGGVTGFVDIVARLLAATFGGAQDATAEPTLAAPTVAVSSLAVPSRAGTGGGAAARSPFPGTT